MDADPPVAHHVDGGLGELVHPHEPLEGDEWLDPLARAVGVRDVVGVRLGPGDPPLLLELGHDRLAALERGHALEALAGGGGHPAVLADDGDLLEPVRPADLEVVGIVPGVILSAPVPNSGLT
jgi:hypothetical protein